jgi:hypothetical protein
MMTVYCLHCFASIAPHSRVCPCCGAAITSWNSTSVTDSAPTQRDHAVDLCLAREVREWIEDYARREWVTEQIMALGDQAVLPLRRYLADGAHVIPQGRLFAVTMLARIGGAEACAGLRDVLHGTSLSDLPRSHQEAERQVKDAAMRMLARRKYPQRAADLVYAVAHERLPSAVIFAGENGLTELAPVLVSMLKDDVLERASAYALEQLEEDGRAAVIAALPSWFEGAHTSTCDRLGLIRGLMLLYQTLGVGDIPSWIATRARGDAHPAVRAAGVLITDRGPGQAMVLMHGALSECFALSLACRERLSGYGDEFVSIALDVLQRNTEPDMYGNQRRLSRRELHWLAVESLKRAAVSELAMARILIGMPEEALLLTMTGSPSWSPELLEALSKHSSVAVRQAAGLQRGRLPTEPGARSPKRRPRKRVS